MNRRFSILYYDRYNHNILEEKVYADKFLYWLYNTNMGLAFNNLLFKRKFFSMFYGWGQNSRWSKKRVLKFVKKYKINITDLSLPLENYNTFNEFFRRKINLANRPINFNNAVCVAPCDGNALVFPFVHNTLKFNIKRHSFDLSKFLRDEQLFKEYSECSLFISRLSLSNYHHFHFPDSGIPDESIYIDGHLLAGGPYSLKKTIPFYTENYRVITPFNSENFGKILICEIGALTVGSIRQTFSPRNEIKKGDYKGYFEIGGSTVALLFKKNAILFDDDLITNSEKGIETFVKMGDSIGKNIL